MIAKNFPLDSLPPWLDAWVTESSAEKGASPDIAANVALGVHAGALARHVQVSPRPGWYEPCNLYLIAGTVAAFALVLGWADRRGAKDRAVQELVSSRHVTTLITNHTFSNLVLRPPGIVPRQG